MLQSKTVLVVEDEAILGENLLTHLRRSGWDARLAATGGLAAQAARAFRPSLVLLDYYLPDMDGFQALAAIREVHRTGRCVLMTGHPSGVVMEAARHHGIRRILGKPFSLTELETTLSSASEDEIAAPPLPPAPPAERRLGERRFLTACLFATLRLVDGRWLTDDRRRGERRQS